MLDAPREDAPAPTAAPADDVQEDAARKDAVRQEARKDAASADAARADAAAQAFARKDAARTEAEETQAASDAPVEPGSAAKAKDAAEPEKAASDEDEETDRTPHIEIAVGPGAVMALLAPAPSAVGATASAGTEVKAASAVPATPVESPVQPAPAGAPALSDEALEAMRQAGAELSAEAAKGDKASATAAQATKAATATTDGAAQSPSPPSDAAKAIQQQLAGKAGATPITIREVQGGAAQPAAAAPQGDALAQQAAAATILNPQAQRLTDRTGGSAAEAATADAGEVDTAKPSLADGAVDAEAATDADPDMPAFERAALRASPDAAAKPTVPGTAPAMPDTAAPTNVTATATATAAVGEAGKAAHQAPLQQSLASAPRPDAAAFAAAVSREAGNGKKTFEIQLDPPELGRVEVRLEFHRDGRVGTHLTVDRQDTLDALSRDARSLERALTQQGFNLDGEGLSFSLRSGGGFAGQFGNQGGSRGGERGDTAMTSETAPEVAAAQPRANGRMTGSSGLDIRI